MPLRRPPESGNPAGNRIALGAALREMLVVNVSDAAAKRCVAQFATTDRIEDVAIVDGHVWAAERTGRLSITGISPMPRIGTPRGCLSLAGQLDR